MVQNYPVSSDSDDNDVTNTNHPPSSRHQRPNLNKPICPYLSSTISDFDEERTYLVNKIFPLLDDYCKLHGSYFSPFDLRWTVGCEQSLTGHALRICLDCVTQSTPYFICLLGERFGPYRPESAPSLPKSIKLLQDDPDWLDLNYMIAAECGYNWILGDTHQNCSFQELEILQAAFLNGAEHCQFYIRQPEHVQEKLTGVPGEEREERTRLYQPESEEADFRIRDLKQRIVQKGLSVKYFRTYEQLGQYVLDDWKLIIDHMCPGVPQQIDTDENLAFLSHETFGETRRSKFISTTEIATVMEELTEFALQCETEMSPDFIDQSELEMYMPQTLSNTLREKKPTTTKHRSIYVLAGERGSGKSAVISNWLQDFLLDSGDIKVVYHYVGCGCHSSNLRALLLRIVTELRQHYLYNSMDATSPKESSDLPLTLPDLYSSFSAALSLGACVIVIDGLDELDKSHDIKLQQIKQLEWLPKHIPPQCKLVVTTTRSDLTYKMLSQRHDVKLVRMPDAESPKFLENFLEEYTGPHLHHLRRNHIQKMREFPIHNNNLFLTILANEVCSFNVFSELPEYLEENGDVSCLREFWNKCLQRWMRDHNWALETVTADTGSTGNENCYIGWIPDALCLISLSRNGISQSELLSVLASLGYEGTSAVTAIDWTRFRQCLGTALYEKPGGLIAFSHYHLKETTKFLLLRISNPVRTNLASTNSLRSYTSFTHHVDTTKDPDRMDKATYHNYIAAYFRDQPHSQRRTIMLPWQLMMAEEYESLVEVITEPDMFLSLCDHDGNHPGNKHDLRHYWSVLRGVGYNVTRTYRQMLVDIQLMSEDDDVEDDQENVDGDMKELDNAIPDIQFSTQSLYKQDAPPAICIQPPSSDRLDVNKSPKQHHLGNPQQSATSALAVPGTRVARSFSLTVDERVRVGWHCGLFLLEAGSEKLATRALVLTEELLHKSYPLSLDNRLLLATIQKKLANLPCGGVNVSSVEDWLCRTLQTLMNISDPEENADINNKWVYLKGHTLCHYGSLRLEQENYHAAETCYVEAEDCLKQCTDIPGRAGILYQIAFLRLKEGDFSQAERSYKQALVLREQWYGRQHHLVADIVHDIADLMSRPDNKTRTDKSAAQCLYRRALAIREKSLGPDHLQVISTLFELGKSLMLEPTQSAKLESQALLRRAYDLSITVQGCVDGQTKRIQQSLHRIDVQIQLKQYEFGAGKSEQAKSKRVQSAYTHKDKKEKSHGLKSHRSSSASISRPRSSQPDRATSGPTKSALRTSGNARVIEKVLIETQGRHVSTSITKSSTSKSHFMDNMQKLMVTLPAQVDDGNPVLSPGDGVPTMHLADEDVPRPEHQRPSQHTHGPAYLFDKYTPHKSASLSHSTPKSATFRNRPESGRSVTSHRNTSNIATEHRTNKYSVHGPTSTIGSLMGKKTKETFSDSTPSGKPAHFSTSKLENSSKHRPKSAVTMPRNLMQPKTRPVSAGGNTKASSAGGALAHFQKYMRDKRNIVENPVLVSENSGCPIFVTDPRASLKAGLPRSAGASVKFNENSFRKVKKAF